MSDQSKIQWTDATWNPVRGCTKVSQGCKNCYAERFAERFRGVPGHPFEQGFDVRLVPEALELPLRWRKPRRIFVNSMSDLFHEDVPDTFIDQVFDVMERTCDHTSRALVHHRPGHVFQVLTKRPARMEAYVHLRLAARKRYADEFKKCPTAAMRDSPAARVAREEAERLQDGIWLGVSVEDQRAADERIPHLLDTPAAVRFLSCEPLLGPVDLRGWGDHAPSPDVSSAPASWSDFRWEEWVPVDLRRHIEDFWSSAYGRGPSAWLRDHTVQQVPRTGAVITCEVDADEWARVDKMATAGVTGRYVHCWNNIGRLITDDGRSVPASGGHGSGWLSRWLTPSGGCRPKLDWVIIGGESGPGARPCDVAWIRSLVAQCRAAGVSAFVKQLGAIPVMPAEAWDALEPAPLITPSRHAAAGMVQLAQGDRKGGDPRWWPEDLRVREMPEVRR